MSTNTLPIVGMFYRPPAKALIDALTIGTPLFLLAEPDNQYDPNAVAVYLESHNIPENAIDALEESLPSFGFSWDSIIAQDQWHLGYIPKDFAAQLRASETVVPNKPVDVTFAVNASGAPRVRFAEAVL
jgi:HIRAN domain